MEQTAKDRAERLGSIIKELRRERGLTLDEIRNRTGLGKSYLSYLEGGKYADVGIDKLARILDVLGAPADLVLQKAGYLSEQAGREANLRTLLKEQLGLSQANLEHAMSYLDYLAGRSPGKGRKR